jgi:hypothetical protein
MSNRSITYNPETRMYDLALDGQPMGVAASYVEGENALDQVVYNRLHNPAYRLAQLATEYQKARTEGRTSDALHIKLEAMRLQAAAFEIEYSEFVAGYAAYVAEKKAA